MVLNTTIVTYVRVVMLRTFIKMDVGFQEGEIGLKTNLLNENDEA